jgi:mercuric ion transport protein
MTSTNSDTRAKKLSIGGAVLAAFAASSCCLGPLLLAALGVGGAGATAALAAYRPFLLVGTAVLLAAGFYFTYRKPRLAEGDACGCEQPRANRAGRIGLWVAAGIVAVVAAAPPLLAGWARATAPQASSTTDVNAAKVTIEVQGIDCEACAAPMRKALAKVGGLHELTLDIPKQSITVTYEPAPGRLGAYVAAINELGYEAKVTDGSEARR